MSKRTIAYGGLGYTVTFEKPRKHVGKERFSIGSGFEKLMDPYKAFEGLRTSHRDRELSLEPSTLDWVCWIIETDRFMFDIDTILDHSESPSHMAHIIGLVDEILWNMERNKNQGQGAMIVCRFTEDDPYSFASSKRFKKFIMHMIKIADNNYEKIEKKPKKRKKRRKHG